MILKYLKNFAEIFEGGKKIKYTVITVSAHFNNLQRIATIEAADKQRLKVIKIINEPTSASIVYIQQIGINAIEKKVLIFDIGGGTLIINIFYLTYFFQNLIKIFKIINLMTIFSW